MNSSGGTSPRVACCQRSSASAALHGARLEVEDRLVDEEQLVAGDRLAQVGLQREPVVRGDVHLVAELGVAVAAGALGLVERDVGVAQQVAGRLAVAGGDADARGDGHRAAGRAEVERLAQHGEDARGHQLGLALDEHDELVAAEAADRVAVAQHAADPPGHRAQQLVAHGVAERVVDPLEAVEVDEHRRRLGAVAPGAGEHALGPVHDQRAVGQPGQRVVQRLVAQLAGLLLDHPQRARPAEREHLDEQEGEQPDDEPADEHERGLHAGRRQPGRRGVADRDDPAAVGVDGEAPAQRPPGRRPAVGGVGRRLEDVGQRADRSARAGGHARLGHRRVLAPERDRHAVLAGHRGCAGSARRRTGR